jgi:hypothetical protein
MKKILILAMLIFMLVSVSAQTKITKKGIVGKWTVSSVQMLDMFYYNFEKDSLVVDEAEMAGTDSLERAGMMILIKSHINRFSHMFYHFNADGTAEIATGMGEIEKERYEIDEERSVIISIGNGVKKDPLDADMLGDKLRIKIKDSSGEDDIVIILRKEK